MGPGIASCSGSRACDEEVHAEDVAAILDGEALGLDQAPEGIAVVEPDHPRHARGDDRAKSPVEAPLSGRDLAIGRGEQEVPAGAEAASDLGDERCGVGEVLDHQDREHAAERSVGERQAGTDIRDLVRDVEAVTRRRSRATSTIRGEPSRPVTS